MPDLPSRHRRERLAAPKTLVALPALLCCADPGAGRSPDADPTAAAEPFTLMSYNLANLTSRSEGVALAAHVEAIAPDFVAAQECADCDAWLDSELDGQYVMATELRSGVALLYDPEVWARVESGVVSLGENDDGWGERVAAWARLSRRRTGQELLAYSTHFCVTIRSPDDDCTTERHLEYAQTVLDHSAARAPADTPVILAGDLNVFDGFEDGPVVARLIDAGMVDVFRVADPDGDGTTFVGSDSAPPGRLDYIFATPTLDVVDAYIDREGVPDSDASDHYPVVGTLAFPASGDHP